MRRVAVVVVVALIWGASVVADSAQFSSAVSELAPPGTAGSALSVQTAVGFTLTSVTILGVGLIDPTGADGWRLAWIILALGPAVGIVAMLRLRGRPDATKMAQRPPMSPFRPDLVDCWIFRVVHSARSVASIEVLLLRRSRPDPARPVAVRVGVARGGRSGRDRRVRELREETGFGPEDIEAFYDLDLVNQFHEPSYDAVVTAAVFAVRVRPGSEPILSHEHDAARWLSIDVAHREVVWPGYRTAIERIRDDLADLERAAWFELTLEGERAPR